ncbi:MAG: thiamine-binding protein [Cyclobacteriaceae bacterium]
MNNQINLGIQIVPIANAKDGYPIIDACIAKIQSSGMKYTVTPFETVLEGQYPEIMNLVNELYDLAISKSEELVINIRIHAKNGQDVYGAEKTDKFNS